jgi:hypothetical protein
MLPGGCNACDAVNKPDDKFCGGCGVAIAVQTAAPVVVAPVIHPAIPSVPKKPPPPAPRKKTVAIETLDDVVISETFVGV